MAKKGNSAAAPKAKKAKSTPISKTKKSSSGSSNGETASLRILKAIASQMSTGITDGVKRDTVQGLAAMTSKKSFDTTILNMKNKGLVTYTKDTIELTDEGLEQVGGPDAVAVPSDNTAMQAKLKELVKGKTPREIFDILTDGKAYTRQELAKLMNMEDNKSFCTYVSTLSKVVERVDRKIRLKDFAFPCGRPCDA